MKKMKVAVLASGGFDSNVLIGDLLRRGADVHPIYIRSGYIWEKAELFWLKKYLKAIRAKNLTPLKILNLPADDMDQGWAVTGRKTPGIRSHDREVYLPGRNLLLLSKAAIFCALKKIPKIAIGTLSGNPFPDASKDFFKNLERIASRGLGFRIKISAPFRGLRKKDLLKKGKELPLHLSFSCLKPRGLHPCGWCNKCAEKARTIPTR